MIHWIMEHLTDITTIIAYIIAIASIIVKLTPSQTDNEWLDKIVAFLKKYIALNK